MVAEAQTRQCGHGRSPARKLLLFLQYGQSHHLAETSSAAYPPQAEQ
jgi:hypothetical protein